MATKLTGIDDMGLPTTAGDSGTLITDGSLILGNSDTDNVTFNADIASNLIPDSDNTVDLGSPAKAWREICVGTRINLHGGGNNDIVLEWPMNLTNTEVISFPASSGTVALEGSLPSFLSFGKNYSQTAPVTNFELSTTNGSQNAQGWRLPVAGVATHMSCQFDAAASGTPNQFKISLWKNGVYQNGYDMILDNVTSGDAGTSVAFATPLVLSANDRLTLMLTMTAGQGASFTMDDLACLIRILN